MLVPNPEEWKLEPMDQYGVEIAGTATEPLAINGPNIVRNAQRHTNWLAVRKQLNINAIPMTPAAGTTAASGSKGPCNCYKCVKARGI